MKVEINDLRGVEGIGDKTLKKIREYFRDKQVKEEKILKKDKLELNKLYCEDNLKVMKSLPSNSIDLIYCDILYGTGNIYDDYEDLDPVRKEINEFYYPRIKEMYRLLNSSGSIYLQMGSEINHWIRRLLDYIFGYENFRNEIKWKRSSGNSLGKRIIPITDHILYYSKTDNYKFNKIFQENKEKNYKVEEETGRKFTTSPLENRNNFKYKGETRVINGKKYFTDMGWKWSQETIDKRLKENPRLFYITNNGKVRYKIYADENKGKLSTDLWDDIHLITSNSNEQVNYKTQKPKELLERIIKASSNKGDVVADFFCGSGTTCVVANELDRKYIGCDINNKAIQITRKRLKG